MAKSSPAAVLMRQLDCGTLIPARICKLYLNPKLDRTYLESRPNHVSHRRHLCLYQDLGYARQVHSASIARNKGPYRLAGRPEIFARRPGCGKRKLGWYHQTVVGAPRTFAKNSDRAHQPGSADGLEP